MLNSGFSDFAIVNFMMVSFVFLLAGAVKGILGMGLPTLAMGLLGLLMPVAQAATLLLAPSLATNLWQMLRGPHLRGLLRRLWPLQAGVLAGVWAGRGWMSPGADQQGTLLLGLCLAAYAVATLAGLRLPRPAVRHERVLSGLMGAATGAVTAATGVFVLPAVPYLQALELNKDEMAQALGLSFTVSTLALAGSLMSGGALVFHSGAQSLFLLGPALVGMWLGQRLREELSPAVFRLVFSGGLLLLGGWLALKPLWV